MPNVLIHGTAVYVRPETFKHFSLQLDATLCMFYYCRVTLHVSDVKRPLSGALKKLARRPLVQMLQLQVGHHITILGTNCNTCTRGRSTRF